MNVLETETAQDLFDSFISTKKKLIADKKIMDKKDKHIYPIKNTAFLIPEDWLWCFLSDVSIIQEGPGIRKHQYENEGVQFLTVTNILEGSVDLNKSKKYISNSEYNNKYEHFTINKGDIVTACSGGSWGKSSLYNLDDKIILNTSTLRLRFFNDLGDNKYLYYLTKTSYFKGNLSSHSTGQQANYGYSHYSKIPIPLPPLSEQKQIVAIIDQAFASIDAAKANAEQNLQNVKELFDSYLQNVFENKGDDWEEKSFEELTLDLLQGINTATDKTKFSLTGIPILQAKEIGDEELKLAKCKFITQSDFAKVKQRYKPNFGDILLNNIGSSLGRSIEVDWDFDFTFAWNVMRVIPNMEFITPAYLNYGIQSPNFQKLIWGSTKGVGMPFISKKNISALTISFPKSIEEQKQIVNKLDAISAESKKLETIYTKKIADLEEMKKSVLQKAFSGQLNTIN